MERIIVGVDAQRASQTAIDWVIERLRQGPARIELVTVTDQIFEDAEREDAEARLARARDRIRGEVPGTPVDTLVLEGGVLDSLVERTRDADLLVIGSHRERELRSALTGARPVRLAARAHCATVIVPDHWMPEGGDEILLGIGEDDSSEAAVEAAVREAARTGSRLHVVHAWQVPTVTWAEAAPLLPTQEELVEFHRTLLGDRVRRIRADHPDLQVRATVVEDNAAAALANAADAALIVVGTHRRGPVTGFLLGSTVQELRHETRLPLMVVPFVPAADGAALDDEDRREGESAPSR